MALSHLDEQSIIETPNDINNVHVPIAKKHIKTLLFCLFLIAMALSVFFVLSAMLKK